MKKLLLALALLFGGSAFATDTVTLGGDNLKILEGKVLYKAPVVVQLPPVTTPARSNAAMARVAPGDNIQAKLDSVPSGGRLVIPAGMTVGALRGKSGVIIQADGAVTVNGNWDFSGLSGWTVRGKAPGQGFVFQGVRINATGAKTTSPWETTSSTGSPATATMAPQSR
jgi:hypothetical protein